MLAPADTIYDLVCNMMAECGVFFVRRQGEWQIVMREGAGGTDTFQRTCVPHANNAE